jgi:hypothetical protein
MNKLEYGKSYLKIFFIIVGIMLFMSRFSKLIGALSFSLCFFYLGIMQLYSGISLNSRWVAEDTKERHPFRFYISVVLSFLVGVFLFIGAMSLR